MLGSGVPATAADQPPQEDSDVESRCPRDSDGELIDNERTMIELIVDDERKRLHKEARDAVENDDDLSEATINTLKRLKRLAKLSQDYVENAEAEEDTDSEADTEKGLEKKDKCLDTEPEEEAPAPQEDPPIVIQDIDEVDEVSDDSDWGPWTKYDKPDSDLTWLELANSEDSD